MMRGFYGGFGGFSWIGMVLNLAIAAIFIIGLILLIIYAVRSLNRRSNNQVLPQGPAVTAAPSSPKEILQARYARGEITREQYLAMLEDLK